MSSYEDLTSKDVERGLNTPKTTSQLTQITSLFTKPDRCHGEHDRCSEVQRVRRYQRGNQDL
jgi:hypothetical protein